MQCMDLKVVNIIGYGSDNVGSTNLTEGVPPKSIGVVWWRNGGVMVCYMMNEVSRVSNKSSKVQLQSSVKKER